MTEDTRISGKRILLLEDDYYLASDACQILKDAGAEVVGPFGRGEDALKALDTDDVDGGVIDINLGVGPEFGVAEALQSRGVRFIFATGYGEGVVPPELKGVRRLEKPYRPAELVTALSQTLE